MPKMKRVSLDKIATGLQVVVSEAPDTQLYTIKETARGGRAVHLVYPLDTPDRKEVSGGWIDYGVCMYPTTAQLANHGTP